MKTLIYTLLLFIGTINLSAQESDLSKIEKTLYYYLDGDAVNDFEIIKKAFHINATMKNVSVSKGYREYNALDVFKTAKKRTTPKPNRIYYISNIDISGTSASAKIETHSPQATVVDYMRLLYIDNEWKIVSKIYSVRKIK